MSIKFSKYPKIYRLGHSETEGIFNSKEDEIIIEEKMDGGNVRFMIIDGKVIVGSRTQQFTDNINEIEKVNKQFEKCVEYVKDKLNKVDLEKYDRLILYGENMVQHTKVYDWNNIPPFLGFDIYDGEKFLNYDTKVRIFRELDLPIVPSIKRVKTEELVNQNIDDDFVPESFYYAPSSEDKQAEGVVFKNYSKQMFAKYVREKFKESHEQVFGKSSKKSDDNTNNNAFLYDYVTNTRIEKAIFKLLDEGHELHMSMMKELPKKVYKDIWEEEWENIIMKNWILDLPKLRKQVPKRCKGVLNQMIANSAMGGVK